MNKITREKYYFCPTSNMWATREELLNLAKGKVLNLTEEKFEGFIIGAGYYPITKGAAKEFYRDLCGSVNGHSDKTCQSIMSSKRIADVLGITVSKTNAYLFTCAEYGITERQGGAWVV